MAPQKPGLAVGERPSLTPPCKQDRAPALRRDRSQTCRTLCRSRNCESCSHYRGLVWSLPAIPRSAIPARPCIATAAESVIIIPMLLFKDHSSDALQTHLGPLGVDARLARRLQAAIVQRGGQDLPEELPEVSPQLLARVRAITAVPHLTLLDKAVSSRDGFAKYLFRGDGPATSRLFGFPFCIAPKIRSTSFASVRRPVVPWAGVLRDRTAWL